MEEPIGVVSDLENRETVIIPCGRSTRPSSAYRRIALRDTNWTRTYLGAMSKYSSK